MRIEQIMGYAAIFFGILGSWGNYKQARMIWSNKSAQSVSGVWTITFLAMFTSFLIYGVQQESFPMKFQGWLRVGFTVPVTLGFMVYGKVERKHKILVAAFAALMVGMSWKAVSPILFLVFSFLGIWASFVQACTIKKNRSRGQVAVELQMIYLSAIICWLVYAIVRGDIPFIIASIGFTLSYSSTIIAWFKYPKN